MNPPSTRLVSGKFKHPLPPAVPSSKGICSPRQKHTISSLNQKLYKQNQLFSQRRDQYQRSKERIRSRSFERKQPRIEMTIASDVRQYIRLQESERKKESIKKYKLTSLATCSTGLRNKNKSKNNGDRNAQQKILGFLDDDLQQQEGNRIQESVYFEAVRQMENMVFVSQCVQQWQQTGKRREKGQNRQRRVNAEREREWNLEWNRDKIPIPYSRESVGGLEQTAKEQIQYSRIQQVNPEQTIYFSMETYIE